MNPLEKQRNITSLLEAVIQHMDNWICLCTSVTISSKRSFFQLSGSRWDTCKMHMDGGYSVCSFSICRISIELSTVMDHQKMIKMRRTFCIWLTMFNLFVGLITGDEFEGMWFGSGWFMYGTLGDWLRPCVSGMQCNLNLCLEPLVA